MDSTNSQLEVSMINSVLENAAKKYTESKATTGAGVILRLIVKLIPTRVIIQMFAHKLNK